MHRNEWLKGIFSFSKSETRGIIVLLIIIAVLLIIRLVMYSNIKTYELQSYISSDTALVREADGYRHGGVSSYYSERSYIRRNTMIVDPNSASYSELNAIGIPSAVSRNLIRYREKGAVYYSIHDLLKVYGFDSLLLATFKDAFIFNPKRDLSHSKNERTGFLPVELNSSDTASLEKLPGIGPVLSTRIIKYRNLLGGFYSPKQLTEVYGIDDSLFTFLIPFIDLDTFSVRKMNINAITLEELERHPYLNRYQAKAIMSYRRLIGPFTSVNQLVNNYLIPEETYYRLLPYLTVNNIGSE